MSAGFSKLPRLPFRWDGAFKLSVMDRYIATELIAPFLFGVGAFSSLGVSVGALFELIRRVTESGLPLSIAFKVLLLQFPQFIVYSFPTSTLMANLMTYSRLSSDSELTALKSCGVSVYRMVLPALVLCTLVTGLTFVFNESIVPASNFRATTTLSEALKSDEPLFQERNILYQEFRNVEDEDGDREEVLSRLFYAKEFNGQQMLGLTILDFSQNGLDQIVSARSAEWNSDQKTWDFSDGTIYVVSADGSFRNIVTFEQQQLQLPRAPLDLASRKRDYDEMNIAESLDYLETLRQSGSESKIQKLRVRIQQKLALPFVCISFGLVGAALGTRLNRTGRATGFAISLLMVFGYYLLTILSGAFAQVGYIPPVLGGWLPNIFGLIIAIWLLIKSSQ
ncbi:LptF/LptG family permease [Thermocoleostomius sinensis A174]|uniref:LptF/LptG family permease n=2 Tax=Thermocoleostomius TaxID=3065395 RepID=A0A9E9CBI0_9CYAN|nr:LptF/LptG family permease [Thermocoleostomius sinensis A174]